MVWGAYAGYDRCVRTTYEVTGQSGSGERSIDRTKETRVCYKKQSTLPELHQNQPNHSGALESTQLNSSPKSTIMKCIAAVVMMVLAVAVQGSSVTYWGNGAALPYLAPATLGSWVQDNSYARIVSPWNYAYQGVPVASPVAAPVAYVEPYHSYQPETVVAVAQKEARYLAANRGAVHEAPLPGHTVNQQSLNLEPAPGTL
uniref:Uncharacterized protein n=2 Tax=Anopheles atroparvus TaxID=41427 RepID=A0A182J4Q8_ANOAO